MVTVRICFVGDSVTAGTGDDGCLGWPARASAGEIARGHDVTCYNLGIRAQTSSEIAARWENECRVRLPDHVDGRLVFSFGLNDCADLNGDGVRIPLADSERNARAILSRAVSWKPVLWLGPTPVRRAPPSIRPGPGITYTFDRERTAELNDRYARIAEDLGVPYLDLYDPLASDPAWETVLDTGDGVHPTGDGYARMAERLAAWPAWRQWFA